MFEAYKIGVRISILPDFAALRLLSQRLTAVDKQVIGLNKRFALIGAGMAGAGVAIAAPFINAIDKAAQLQKQMIGIQSATHGSAQEMDNLRGAIEGIAAKTVFSNIDVAQIAKTIATGTTFSTQQVANVLPAYTRFADVQMMMKGTGYQESIPELIRLAHTAQKYSPEEISAYGDVLTKASMVIPGGLSELGHALKYSQGIAQQVLGVDPDSMVLVTALLNQMGLKGSRGGTNLIAAMGRTIPGIFGSGLLKGKSNEALRAMGMVDKAGHSKVFTKEGNFDIFAWLGLMSEYVHREFASYPAAIARQHIMVNNQHAFGTQGSRVTSLLDNSQAMELLDKIGARFIAAGGVEEIQTKFANESVAQQYMNAKTNFASAMTELGYTLLPLASQALTGLNTRLGSMIEWLRDNQERVKALSYGFLALAGTLAIGGTLALTTAAFRGLWTVVSLAPALFTPAGLALAGVAGAAYLVARNWDTVGPVFDQGWQIVKAALDQSWSFMKEFGAWIKDWFTPLWEPLKAVLTFIGEKLMTFKPIADAVEAYKKSRFPSPMGQVATLGYDLAVIWAKKHNEQSAGLPSLGAWGGGRQNVMDPASFVPGSPRVITNTTGFDTRPIQVTTQINLDGHQIAEVVTNHQVGGGNATGTTGLNPLSSRLMPGTPALGN
jgi:hypothetical protein